MKMGQDERKIASYSRTMEMLQESGITLKKSLGQNFLIDYNVIQNIVRSAEIDAETEVFEIGPGIGSLTQALAETAKRVVAVEIDQRIIPIIEQAMQPYGNVEIIHADLLEINVQELVQQKFERPDEVHVVANLPYYATSAIIMHLLESGIPFPSIVVMIQKEVADRLAAAPGSKEYGSLSVTVQYYCQVEKMLTIPNTVFVPRPKVDSAVIRLLRHRNKPVQVRDEAFFFEVVRASFAQRRKTLFNNLANRFFKAGDKNRLQQLLFDVGIDPTRRGETLTLHEFARLSDALHDELID